MSTIKTEIYDQLKQSILSVSDDQLDQRQKNQLQQIIEESQKRSEEENKLLEILDKIEYHAFNLKIKEILFHNDEVIFYSVTSRNSHDQQYPYRFIYKKDDKWLRSIHISNNFENLFLQFLETKYLGLNSQFTQFAIKMLKADIKQLS